MLALKKILHPTDFSECAEQALRHALFLARQHDAAVQVLHVVLAIGTELREQGRARLHAVMQAHDTEGLHVEEVVDYAEGAGAAILQHARKTDADLIVMGTHGRHGLARVLIGSTAEKVAREAECPVLIIREQDAPAPPERFETLLVPVDFSEHSRRAVAYAQALAAQYKSRLTFAHAMEDVAPLETYADLGVYPAGIGPAESLSDAVARTREKAQQMVEEELEQMAQAARENGLEATYVVGHGSTASYLLDVAEEHGVDLIVLASHGRTGLERFLMGSVAEKVVRRAPCPVFMVKAHGKQLVHDES